MKTIRASPISKFGAQHDHLIKTTNCQWKMGKEGATSWFLGTFFSCSTLLCVIMARFRKNTPFFSDIHSIDMILIRSSQCSWRTEDEMKHSAIPVGLGKQNSCLNYANVTAFLLNRSDSKSPTKLSSRKWHRRFDWQWNKFFGIKKNKIRSLLWFLIGWFREGLNGKTTFSFGQCLIIKINDHHFKTLFTFYRISGDHTREVMFLCVRSLHLAS